MAPGNTSASALPASALAASRRLLDALRCPRGASLRSPLMRGPVMRTRLRALLALVILTACLLAVSCNKEAAPGPDVWAVVNGKDILRDQVEKIYPSRADANSNSSPSSPEEALSLKLSILDQLITNEILLERATTMNLAATDAEVEEKFSESKSPYTEEEFQQKLKETGLSVDDLKSNIREQLSIQKLLNREVVAKISITDKDVSDFYDANRAQFNVPEPRYHIAQIVVTPRPDPSVHNASNDKATTPADAAHKAELIEQKLKSGADFSELATDYSEDSSASTGGDLGFVPESAFNQSDPEIKRILLGMKPGQVTQPLPIKGGGFRILKLIDREAAGQRQFADVQVQQAIRDALRTRKEQLLRSAYLTGARKE